MTEKGFYVAYALVVARGEDGRQSTLFVHRQERSATYALSLLNADLTDRRMLLKIDEGTGNRVVETTCDGVVSFEGYGVAVVTNAVARTDEAGRVAWS